MVKLTKTIVLTQLKCIEKFTLTTFNLLENLTEFGSFQNEDKNLYEKLITTFRNDVKILRILM